MKKIFNKISASIVYGIFYPISLLPFCVLYAIADFEYYIIYYLIRYRRKVVRNNLVTSFPEKSEEEIKQIEKKFYHWFADYFFESIKLLSISDKELRKRFIIINPEEITEFFKVDRNVSAILGHYCNWEWLSCCGLGQKEDELVALVYHPLYNYAFDRLFYRLRHRLVNGIPIPKNEILRYLIKCKQEGTHCLCGLISDQAPKWENIHLWVPFLNHDTPVFTGAERLMKKFNNAVFYLETSRPKRGYYTCTYHFITDDANNLPEHEITRRFFQMLEKTIQRQPEYYLWTHNRWKRTHEEFDRRFKVVNGKVIPRDK
ncbi:MAG: acetyltransferase [Prevotella sp.]|nr:acetyltransferase [Prevotella sp.]